MFNWIFKPVFLRRLLGGLVAVLGAVIFLIGSLMNSYIPTISPFLDDKLAQRFLSCVIDQDLLGPNIRLYRYDGLDKSPQYFEIMGGRESLSLIRGTDDALGGLILRGDEEEVDGDSLLQFEYGLVEGSTEQLARLGQSLNEYPINTEAVCTVLSNQLYQQLQGRISRFREMPLVLPELMAAQAHWALTRRFIPLIYRNEGARVWLQNPLTFLVPGMCLAFAGVALAAWPQKGSSGKQN